MKERAKLREFKEKQLEVSCLDGMVKMKLKLPQNPQDRMSVSPQLLLEFLRHLNLQELLVQKQK